jgi:hypothetical protein
MRTQHQLLVGWLVFWIAALWLLPNTQQWLDKHKPAFDFYQTSGKDRGLILRLFPNWTWSPAIPWALCMGTVLAVSVMGLSQVTEFLYWQF